MKFLTDQDVYQATVELLRGLGYEVETAREVGVARALDEELLKRARNRRRVLMTRDKGFGALTFVRTTIPAPSAGAAERSSTTSP